MKQKKILFLNAKGLGDGIIGIPKLVDLKKDGHRVYQFHYDERYFPGFYPKGVIKKIKYIIKKPKRNFILDILKKNKLIDDTLEIPFGIVKLMVFLIRNFKRFDEVIIPIKTKSGTLLGKILGKKHYYFFESGNDITKYRRIIEGEMGSEKINKLYDYCDYIKFDEKKIPLPDNYIVLAPSMMERSPLISERGKIIDYILETQNKVVIVGSEREQRFIDELKKTGYNEKVIGFLGKTSFDELIYIIKHAKMNILCDGGLLWLGKLLNKHNINIHTSNGLIFEPPVDNKNSFNIRIYKYPNCKPCSARDMKQQNTGRIPKCVFYGTDKEGMCRKVVKANIIIDYIENILGKKA